MTSDRPNTDLAAAVEAALLLAEQHGVHAAAAFLAACGAGFALTCRVLTQPQARRVSAAPEQASPAAQR